VSSAQGMEVKVDSKRLLKALEACPDELFKALKVAGADIGKRYFGYHAARRMMGGAKRDKSKGVNATRAGLLAEKRRMVDLSGSTLDALRMLIKFKSPIAVIHEFGRVITPKKSVYMTLPMPAAKGSDTRVTKKARALITRSKSVLAQLSTTGGKAGASSGKGKVLFPIRRRDGKIFLVTSSRLNAKKSKSSLDQKIRRKVAFGSRFVHGIEGQKLDPHGVDKFTFWFHLVKSAVFKPRLDFTGNQEVWQEYYKTTGLKRFNQAVKYALAAARQKARGAG
jgi:hypothetical protein